MGGLFNEISWNCWWGQKLNQLEEAIVDLSVGVTVFHFQEVTACHEVCGWVKDRIGQKVWSNLFRNLQGILPKYQGYFFENGKYTAESGEEICYGNALFIQSHLKVLELGQARVAESQNGTPRYMPYALVQLRSRPLFTAGVHGIWTDGGKGDTPERLEQSRNIVRVLSRYQEFPRVLMGDFNLLPETESLKIVEEAPMFNVSRKHDFPVTRSSLMKRLEGPDAKYADYAFVSEENLLHSFKVLPDEASDHLPLWVKLNLAV